MAWFPALLLVLVVVTLIGAAVWWDRQHSEERRRVWREVASRRGGRYVEPVSGLFRSSSEAIEAAVGHAMVRLDLYVVSTGKSSVTYTRARARFAIGAGPAFSVYEEGVFSAIGKALGAQDLELGDAPFDEQFIVKGSDPEAVKAAWTARARSILQRTLHRTRADSDGAEVKLVVVGAMTDPAVLEAMLELAAELASFGARELDALDELRDVTLVPVAGTWESPTAPYLRIATEGGEATAYLRPGTLAPGLDLSLASERALPSFTARVSDGAAEGLPRGVLTDAARALLGAVDGAVLSSSDRELRLSWSLVPTADTVASGAKLLAELAGGSRSAGAFR